ncbi:MAG: chemotaxis-specific protein-glutamate methyltransferase CheB [Pseudomonadota bacterium]
MIRVLVVDDSALVRKLFGRVLTDAREFEVMFARNGLEALEQLEVFRPDVITLDINMPQMNGLECLDRIMILRPCPVIMVSTLTAEGAEETLNALRLGAVDFVAKPSGAVSLHIDSFTPTFLDKIRSAATAKLPASRRLRERVQLKTAGVLTRAEVSKAELSEIQAEPLAKDSFVLVGTSTGGPPALEALLVTLPANFPWPIVVAQHMPASFTGSLAKRLDGICALNVVEVSKPMLMQPGCVYIGRGDADVVISRRPAGLIVMATPARSNYLWHPSVDRLVRSAMEHVPACQLIGILMTGMGNDGAIAMTELRSKGGKTIAEAEETAIVWGMPGELVKAGGADWVVPLPKIAGQLQKLVPNHAANP